MTSDPYFSYIITAYTVTFTALCAIFITSFLRYRRYKHQITKSHAKKEKKL